jgi:thioesterase domain-containing protein
MGAAKPIASKPIAGKLIAVLVAVLLIAAGLAATGGTALAQSPAGGENAGAAIHGRAYLFRGLIGINRAGVAANISSHFMWRNVASQAISDYRRDPKPIAVIGHSIGGDEAMQFAEALGAAHIPVSLLITYDPNRSAHPVPANVERYINLYQSSNFLGGGDVEPGPGFHGHYASFNLKDRPEIIHVNMDKFDRIQELLAAKVRSMSARGEGEAVPLHIVFAATGPIELWDSGKPVAAQAGDTLQSLAAANHVPLWALVQINQKPENATLTAGERIVVPRYLGR